MRTLFLDNRMEMISANFQSNQTNTIEQRREQIKQWMQLCRESTLALFEKMDYPIFCQQAHPDYSPVGWHLGHIGYTECLWLLERCAKSSVIPVFQERKNVDYRRLFAADGLPKGERANLPTLAETIDYLAAVREQVFDYLQVAPLEEQERLWRFILQHESQHCETIVFLLELQRKESEQTQLLTSSTSQTLIEIRQSPEIYIPAGEFEMGSDSIDALDNERPSHRVYLDSYSIDRCPVTCGEYRQFMLAGGYQNRELWSSAGWEWLQANPITQPLYWQEDFVWENHPVCGVSWYEADAYARFVGKRLPTEAEWEKAASWDAVAEMRRTYPWGEAPPDGERCNHNYIYSGTTPVNARLTGESSYGLVDALGNVWEWTASWFDAYEGFEYYPYRGYSQVYFDGEHRVLKGGSWITRPFALRCSFRNWYHPFVREIFAGFRCARSW